MGTRYGKTRGLHRGTLHALMAYGNPEGYEDGQHQACPVETVSWAVMLYASPDYERIALARRAPDSESMRGDDTVHALVKTRGYGPGVVCDLIRVSNEYNDLRRSASIRERLIVDNEFCMFEEEIKETL